MKRIYKLLFLVISTITFFNACDVDNTDYSLETRDVFINTVTIEAARNNCIDEDIQVSVVNYARTLTATLPTACESSNIVLTFDLGEGITIIPNSDSGFETGSSKLLVSGFGLEEEYTVNLNVLEPFESDVEFVSRWRVEADETITLPLIEAGSYNFRVFWGDGEESIVAAYDLESASHMYTEAGNYDITVWGEIDGFNFYETDISADNILDILSWGQVQLGNDENYFRGCSNLQISAQDAPDLSETTNLKAMFRDATSFNSNINHWDVSGVTTMQDMFYGAPNYNQPLDQWDVRQVTTFETMFRNSSFDQDITGWDISNATVLKNMFRDSPFNQAIGVWDVSNVTDFQAVFRGNNAFDQDLSGWGDKLQQVVTMREMFRESAYNGDLSAWDVSHVVSMWDMFKDSGFNNPSINGWDVSGLDNMETMFGGQDCAFNQDISGWDVGNVVNMQNLFQENRAFNQDLSGWDVSSVMCNYNFDTDAPQWEEVHKPQFDADRTDNNEYCNRDN